MYSNSVRLRTYVTVTGGANQPTIKNWTGRSVTRLTPVLTAGSMSCLLENYVMSQGRHISTRPLAILCAMSAD